jgi:geranylgeranyl diphosphate synthase type II
MELDAILPSENADPSIIHKAMRYSVFSGGKRLRPILTLATAEMLGMNIKNALSTACSIELIHTFSLIHDDLPSIDNDDFRRGKPSCHKVYGEGIALLAGDALLVHAYKIILQNAENKEIQKSTILKLLEEITRCIDTENMIGGQVKDIINNRPEDKLNYLLDLYKQKTAALIIASITSGATLAGAKKSEIKALRKYGECIGLAFQITDDILDIMQDQRNEERITYPGVAGLKKARKDSEQLIKSAKDALEMFGNRADFFFSLADYIFSRQK